MDQSDWENCRLLPFVCEFMLKSNRFAHGHALRASCSCHVMVNLIEVRLMICLSGDGIFEHVHWLATDELTSYKRPCIISSPSRAGYLYGRVVNNMLPFKLCIEHTHSSKYIIILAALCIGLSPARDCIWIAWTCWVENSVNCRGWHILMIPKWPMQDPDYCRSCRWMD